MVVTTIASLQKTVDAQSKQILKLQLLLVERKEKYVALQSQYKYLEQTINDKIESELSKFKDIILKENEKLKAENQSLRSLLNKDSNNSGIPTSKTPIGKQKKISNSREKSERSVGGQEGHSKHKLVEFKEEELTEKYYHEVKQCPCGHQLREIGFRTKDEFDLNISVQKIRHHFMEYQCTCCHRKINVPIPSSLKEENQYGNHVKALILSLVNEGCVSFNRTRSLIKGFSGNEMSISEGFMVKQQKNCFQKLEQFEKDMKLKLLNEKVICWDDTVITVDGKQSCLRFYGTDALAFYVAHEHKNRKGLDEDGILQFLTPETTVVHDHNIINYNGDYEFQNAECCVHLLRDLKSLNEDMKRDWLDDMRNLLLRTNQERKKYMETAIPHFEDQFIDETMEEYDQIMKRAQEKNKTDFNKYYGTKEKTLIERLLKYKSNYLTWIIRFDIPFSNNLSERSLRSSKTKMKVSGQFKTITNASYYARIKSYIETCKRNGINEHTAFIRLLDDNPYTLRMLLNKTEITN